MGFESLQQERILIRDADYNEFPLLFRACQWFRGPFWHPTVHRRDAMPMGIKLRMSEFCRDALLEPLGDEMFKPLGLLVNFSMG